MRLGRGRDISSVEAVHGKQLVQGVAGGLAVRGGVDGRAGGAVCGDFEFVFGGFVASLVRLFAFILGRDVSRTALGVLRREGLLGIFRWRSVLLMGEIA
jgi:hypothetical protein